MNLDEYRQDLSELDDRERFIYLIELGNTLSEYPQEFKTTEYEVPGCTSLVYLHARVVDTKIHYQAYAAAKVVRGYLRILLDALNNKSPQEIIEDSSIDAFIRETKMNVSTQASRANAFGNMYAFMKEQARNLISQ